MKRNEERPLPPGWVKDFLYRADLDASYRGLDGCPHFHAATMRGRIRTLQLQPEQAWDDFDEAEAASRLEEESVSNLMRVFLLQVYRFENAMLEQTETEDPDLEQPLFTDLPEFLLDEFPQLRRAMNLRQRIHGTYLLYAGHSAEALRVFKRLARDRRVGNEALAHSYLSLACCHFNLGDDDEVRRFLDTSELAIHACDSVLNRGYFCGLLYALYTFTDQIDKALEWREFLYSLPCPEKTKDLLLERGERFVARCRQQNQLLVF